MDVRQALEQFQVGRSEEAFCALFEYVYPRLRRYFMIRGMELLEAEDLAQNVMVLVYRHAGEVRDRELFLGWVFKAAKNELARYWRQRRTRDRIARMEPLSDELARTLVDESTSGRQADFMEWMSHLEASEREILILRYVEELSYEDLSLALGIPLGTVKWRLFNARKKLAPIINRTTPGAKRRIH